MRDTKRGGIDLLSGTSGKVVAELWNSLSADAVTPQWCFWDCSAVPNGLRLHPAMVPSHPWAVPEGSLCSWQKFRIHADIRVFNSHHPFRLLPMLILLVLWEKSWWKLHSEDFERCLNYSWPLSNLWLSLNQRIQSGMSSETESQGISAWRVGWVKCDYPWCLCQAELLPASHCCSHTLALLWGPHS